jgi:hypothetical protein
MLGRSVLNGETKNGWWNNKHRMGYVKANAGLIMRVSNLVRSENKGVDG